MSNRIMIDRDIVVGENNDSFYMKATFRVTIK